MIYGRCKFLSCYGSVMIVVGVLGLRLMDLGVVYNDLIATN